MWGTGFALPGRGLLLRFIPTCVGNGRISRRWPTCHSVHPHVCGERGHWKLEGKEWPRFIPTCVGNGGPPTGHHGHDPVHPHVCGERGNSATATRSADGSSPRVWGTALRPSNTHATRRFIPTCVGNGASCRRLPIKKPVHPHVCGERVFVFECTAIPSGSSPRVWGTGHQEHRAGRVGWFIPTCVGNGEEREAVIAALAVHPHVCGERNQASSATKSVGGSSPRVWGTVPCCCRNVTYCRFIPTCVGNGGALDR